VDGDLFLSDEHKIDCQRDIQQYITEELNEANLDVTLSYYLTSIYDHSVFEAFSKVHSNHLVCAAGCHCTSSCYNTIARPELYALPCVLLQVVQKLIPQLPTLENLLNCLISNCNMEKSFLFDVVSRIYLATDSNPVDMQVRCITQLLRLALFVSLPYSTCVCVLVLSSRQ
jgi:Ras-related GTP-binding protein C/D